MRWWWHTSRIARPQGDTVGLAGGSLAEGLHFLLHHRQVEPASLPVLASDVKQQALQLLLPDIFLYKGVTFSAVFIERYSVQVSIGGQKGSKKPVG